jgi:hypothetical protein
MRGVKVAEQGDGWVGGFDGPVVVIMIAQDY